MTFYEIKEGHYPKEHMKSKKDEIQKNGWSIKEEKGTFYLCYISGSLQGELKEIEISKIDFELARDDKIDLDTLCIKYGAN
ncbi:hypothetical protein [Spartinivicinus ruber]|uniref:hypothetical protein n=1 Tax=Spartinivicinus ruber TaxID=2683272 RepID=UPI0013D6178E|nr:hypothetical protein [Spartinivicinus ruber]